MNPTLRIDSREWQAAARKLFDSETKKSLSEFLNGQALFVASQAVKLTEKADRRRIEHQMGVITSKEKLRGGAAGAKGWVRITKRQFGQTVADTLGGRILLKRHAATGRWGYKGKTLADKVRAMVAAKVRSVGFIRSGWIWAVRDLSAFVYGGPRLANAREAGGAKKGYAIPARLTWADGTHVEIGSTSLGPVNRSHWHGAKGNPLPIAEAGLQAALKMGERDMLMHLEKRIQKAARRAGFTT